jgi:hypothetical protein
MFNRKIRCETCKFLEIKVHNECIRFPPVITKNGISKFPKVDKHWKCGEWRKK